MDLTNLENCTLAYQNRRNPQWIRKTHLHIRRSRRESGKTKTVAERKLRLRALLPYLYDSLKVCHVRAHPSLSLTWASRLIG